LDGDDQVAAAPPPPPAAIETPAANETLYTSARVRIRERPSTDASIVTTLAAGEVVQSDGQDGEWRRVSAGARIGWVHGKYLTSIAPVPPAAMAPVIKQPVPAPVATFKPKAKAKPERNEGDPIREAYIGRCDCPYDVKRNGASCGGTSAWSRPGGREPVCFAGEE
jgi:uncharacterized protein YraI